MAAGPVCGGGDVLVGAYRMKMEAAQHNRGGNGGEILWNRANTPCIYCS